MANQKHLDILKQGVEVWNKWRDEHKNIWPDLSGADLSKMDLSGANLNFADLSGSFLYAANLRKTNVSRAYLVGASLNWANLNWANLSGSYLSRAELSRASLLEANLVGADLSHSIFHGSDLSGAKLNGSILCAAVLEASILRQAELSKANLDMANLLGANLSGTNLSEANLHGTSFNGAILRDADLSRVTLSATTLADVDLSHVKGLTSIRFEGRSEISIGTIYLSKGNIPEVFLRGAGVPEPFIANMYALVESMSPIDFYSCFISYSSKNQGFADRLYADLQSKGVRCWYAPKDMKIGDEIRVRIDESIRLYDKLLVVLSEHSVNSAWVEDEVEAALEKERLARERGERKTVLFPIQLDDAVKGVTAGWPAKIRRTRHLGDFRNWDKSHADYIKAFERLLRDMKAEV